MMCVVEQAVGHLAAGALDGVGFGRVVGPDAEGAVGERAGELDRAVGADKLAVHRPPGEGEVLPRAHGVDAVERVGRDRRRAEQVALGAARRWRSRSIGARVDARCAGRRRASDGRRVGELDLLHLDAVIAPRRPATSPVIVSGPTSSRITTPPGAQTSPATSCRPTRVLMLQPNSVKTFCTSTASLRRSVMCTARILWVSVIFASVLSRWLLASARRSFACFARRAQAGWISRPGSRACRRAPGRSACSRSCVRGRPSSRASRRSGARPRRPSRARRSRRGTRGTSRARWGRSGA